VSGVEYVRGRLSSAPVVLLPGLFAGAWMWKPTWDCLIGLGHSVLQIAEPFAALDTKATSIGALRSMLIGVLDEHDIFRVVLCGNSLGSLVALDTACHHPDRVEAMVISGCPGLGETANLGLRHSGDMSRQNADRVADQLFYDRSVISEEMIERSYAIARDRRCAINMLRYVLATRKYDVRKCLPQIQCDVLMIWGEHDRVAPVEDWEQSLSLFANASLHKLARCGHSPMIENPAEFNAILTKFMLERPSGSESVPKPLAIDR
jgi:2-hydroxy-6-oxonona-2,4-dienedioate hydrolase